MTAARAYADVIGSAEQDVGASSRAFGAAWQTFTADMPDDPHLPELEEGYVAPLLKTQVELIEALDELRLAARAIDEAVRDIEADERVERRG